MTREFRFRAFVDLKLFKVMVDNVNLGIDAEHTCACDIDSLKEAIGKIGWKINDDDEFENIITNEKISFYDAGALEMSDGDDLFFEKCEIMQFSGKLGYNKKELHDGDIVFYEEAEENGDKRYYLVIVWIPEWCMFASIFVDEYHKFIKNGALGLDESMFWTYTLEQSEHFHYAGDIHQNPELLGNNVDPTEIDHLGDMVHAMHGGVNE